MHFASLPPWWLTVLAALALAAAVFAAYRRPLAPLSTPQRAVLIGLRSAALIALLLVLFRPVVLLPPAGDREQVVPVLIDISRSMRVADADGDTRIARAAALLRFDLLPLLSRQFHTELLSVGDAVETASIDALDGAREPERPVRRAGVGPRTLPRPAGRGRRGAVRRRRHRSAGARPDGDGAASPWPVFAIGVGSASGSARSGSPRDRGGDQRLEDASVDLQVSAVSSGFGRDPFQVRVLAGGKLLESRRVVPSADGSPIEQRFTVFPDPRQPTVYTVEIPAGGRRACRREQHAQRHGEPGRTQAPSAGHRGRAWVRAHVRQEGMGGRPRARGRCGRSKRHGRQRQRYLPDSGGRRPCHHADHRLPGEARGSLRLRCRHRLERRGRLLHARPVDDDRGLRVRARRRPARDRRPIVRAARAGGHARRSGSAGGARRTTRRDRSRGPRRARAGQRPRRHGRGRDAPDHAARRVRRGHTPEVGRAARAGHRPRRSAVPGRAPSCSPPRRPPAAPCSRSSPCSRTAAAARWCSAAKRRGAGG